MRIETESLPYRMGVGIMILNKQKQIFVAKRLNSKTEAWQMPQGGIEDQENPLDALYREMYEEIGTNKFTIIAESKDWMSYEIPQKFMSKFWYNKYRGQMQKWYLANFFGEDSDINLDLHEPEFSEWCWIDQSELINIVVEFKQELYKQILQEFQSILQEK